LLLEDLDNPVGARFDQNRAAVYDRVAIIPNAIFRRHIVIGDARLGQNGAHPDVLAILIGGMVLLGHIAVKTGTLFDAENARYATHHAANDTADDGADRTGGSFAFPRASLNPAGDPFLGLRRNGKRHGGGKGSNSDKTSNHDNSNGAVEVVVQPI
jgi:hypothetical protein